MAWVQPPQFGSCPASNNFGIENREEYLYYISHDLNIYRYGVRVTTEECYVAVFVMSVQSIVGVIIQVTTLHCIYTFTIYINL